MINTKAKLLRLVGQLTAPGVDGEMLRQRFNRLPISVMDDFDLEADARLALLSMDPATVGDYLKSELLAWAFPPGEFPTPDPKCYIPPPVTVIGGAYAMPNPQFKAVRPETGPAGGLGFDFTLYGEGLLLPIQITLSPKGTGTGTGTATTYDASNATMKAEGTFRCGQVKVTADLPQIADTYDVKVFDLLDNKTFEVPSVGVTFKVT